jgi:hypothetical protein
MVRSQAGRVESDNKNSRNLGRKTHQRRVSLTQKLSTTKLTIGVRNILLGLFTLKPIANSRFKPTMPKIRKQRIKLERRVVRNKNG